VKILMAASEVVPFAKTGGLADVAGAIPKYLCDLGHDIRIIMPYYKIIKEKGFPAEPMEIPLSFRIHSYVTQGSLYQTRLPGTHVKVYLIEEDKYFLRDHLYGTSHGDYPDNCERFVFFSRAILETILALEEQFDVVHCNDWQTGLVPVYMKTLYADQEFIRDAKVLYTVHNLGYQGVFWHLDMPLTGLPWSYFNWKHLEFYGKLNLMKGGLVFTDAVSTVSKAYSQEIQTEEYGHGLDGVLRDRADNLYGILNGIDYSIWNPETDSLIPANYGPEDLGGKAECKAFLQKEFGLPSSDVPIIGSIGRLAAQKGIDLLAEAMPKLMELDLQFCILGTGEEKYHRILTRLHENFPKKLGLKLAYDNKLAHRIEAGADMFIMPSRYEPCGLNQLISLKYGTVPIVRSTGGLADTITDFSPEALEKGTANGFSFKEYRSDRLTAAVERAVTLYKNKDEWHRLMRNGMRQDWSWGRSAREYETVYKKLAGDETSRPA
jgi:starch synthase